MKLKRIITAALICLIVCLAFYLRIKYLSYCSKISYDGIRYNWIAKNLLNQEGFGYSPNNPTSWRPPGFPFFLYAIYSLAGYNPLFAQAIACLLDSLLCLILFLLAKKITSHLSYSTTIGLTAAFLYAINGLSIAFCRALLTELFSAFLITLAIYLFYLANDAKGRWFYLTILLASIIFWYNVLTRPSNMTFWFWIGLWFLMENRQKIKRVMTFAATVILGFSLIVLPWTMRNYRLHHKFLLISSNGGFIFFMAHHPKSEGKFIKEKERYTPSQEKELKGLSEFDKQKKHYQYGLEFIKSHPVRELQLIFIKQKLLWFSGLSLKELAGFLPHIPFLLLGFHFILFYAIAGIYFVSRNLKPFLLLIFNMIDYALIISLFYFYDSLRMRFVLLPPLCIFAAISIVFSLSGVTENTKGLLHKKQN